MSFDAETSYQQIELERTSYQQRELERLKKAEFCVRWSQVQDLRPGVQSVKARKALFSTPREFEIRANKEKPLNVPLFRKTVEWIEWQNLLDHEDRQWDQLVWLSLASQRRDICDTKCCFAGKIALETGHVFRWSYGVLNEACSCCNKSVLVLAMEELNIQNAWGLFQANNTADDIRMISEWMCGERL